jgi:hypothetical protein
MPRNYIRIDPLHQRRDQKMFLKGNNTHSGVSFTQELPVIFWADGGT